MPAPFTDQRRIIITTQTIARPDRDQVVGIDGRQIVVGDRVAFTAAGWNKKHAMGVGTVRRISATRTVIDVEKSSKTNGGGTSAIDDSLGRILLLDAPLNAAGVEAGLREVISQIDYDISKEIDRAGTDDAEDEDAEGWGDLVDRFTDSYDTAVAA